MVVYTAESLALAAVEFFVHFDRSDAEAPLVAIAAEIPATFRVSHLEIGKPAAEWRQDPAPEALQEYGREWVKRNESAVLSVPSAVIPVERNYLLNPGHPDFERIQIGAPQPFDFDLRMWKRGRR
jgi:RES domain-containing protein